MGVNDIGWDKVLEEFRPELDRAGFFEVDAADIKRLSGREPRLMAKHDWSTARPQVFQELGLSMVPVSRSRYRVGRFDLYEPFPATSGPARVFTFPAHIESVDFASLNSESLALNAASIVGMFEHFLGCGPLHATLNGRMSSGTFDIELGGQRVTIDRAQMEIDGGFESAECLVLVEAKNSLPADFNIRQLYFPFRRFSAVVHKPVIPLYQLYSNGVFQLFQYEFPDPADMTSIRLVKSAAYALGEAQVNLADILAHTREVPSAIPFPQADSFARVVNLLELLPLSLEEISEEYDFTGRQAHYYSAALRFLGLADAALRPAPAFVAAASRRERAEIVLRAMASRPVLREAMEIVAQGRVPEHLETVQLMERLNLAESTRHRRARTVVKWMEWVMATITPALPL